MSIAQSVVLSRWLAQNIRLIAGDEAAGECLRDMRHYVKRIEDLVDPPEPTKWLGNCPTWNEHTRRSCGESLWAREDMAQVRCPRCRETHNTDRLKLLLFNDLEREKVSWEKILRANKSQPEDRQVRERTLQSWRSTGRLKVRGYRRASDGRLVINRHSPEDTPLYLWADIRRLRDEKPQKSATGGAAHGRNRQSDKAI